MGWRFVVNCFRIPIFDRHNTAHFAQHAHYQRINLCLRNEKILANNQDFFVYTSSFLEEFQLLFDLWSVGFLLPDEQLNV